MKVLNGSKIRERREQRGMSQEYLARAIGKSVSSINRFEHNKTEPTASILYAISKALGCKMEAFFEK